MRSDRVMASRRPRRDEVALTGPNCTTPHLTGTAGRLQEVRGRSLSNRASLNSRISTIVAICAMIDLSPVALAFP